jgi:hypothetical protein
MERRRLVVLVPAVFVLALAGAGYAVYTLVPGLVGDPRVRDSLRLFGIVLIGAFGVLLVAGVVIRRLGRRGK